MAKFLYQAKKNPQETIEDILEAENLDQAVTAITALGYVPLSVTPYFPTSRENVSQSRKKRIGFRKKIPISHIASLTRQLYDLIDSGIPLLRALGIATRQVKDSSFKEMIDQIYIFVQDGASFSEALMKYKDVFPVLYINMIKAGEISGNLALILDRLSVFLEKDEETRSKIKSSLIYPCLILLVGAITVFVLLTFVIPRLTDMFQDLSASLPLPTLLLISMSDFLAQFWWIILFLLFVMGFFLKRYSVSQLGEIRIDRLKLKLPIIGQLIQHGEIARFSRTLATLLSSGVAIVPALESVSDVLDNKILKAEAKEIAKRVSSGSSLSDSMKASSFFPEFVCHMIAIGEESGRLDSSLSKLASSYEKKTQGTIKIFVSLLEPLLIVGIGLIIGFVIISMLLPIFQMNFIIQ